MGESLVLGLGGGSDAIVAYAIARLVGGAYANTKTELDADMLRISVHVGALPPDAPVRGATKIERRLPRGPHGSPLVVACPRQASLDDIAAELAVFDHVIAVDTGGDSLAPADGRDRRMLEIVRRMKARSVLVVIAPGSDGQQSAAELAPLLRRAHGAFSIAPLVPALREHGAALGPTRTPNIICRAFDEATDPIEIPRGKHPRIPRQWLTAGLVFTVRDA